MVAGTQISARNLTGRYMPARISPHSRWQFIRDRRAALLRRIGGAPPDERQALTISMLIDAEWALTVAQHDAEAAPDMRTRTKSMRLAADARKQILLWNRELVTATPQPSARNTDRPYGEASRPSRAPTRRGRVIPLARRERTPLARFAARPGASERGCAIALLRGLSRSFALPRRDACFFGVLVSSGGQR